MGSPISPMSSDTVRNVDCVIVGAGPAGVQLAADLRSSGVSLAILEASDDVGSFFRKFPRNRWLLSFNKTATIFDDPETNLRWDWNSLLSHGDDAPRFADYSQFMYPKADELVRYIEAYAKHYDVPVEFNQRVVLIEPGAGDGYRVVTEQGSVLEARYVVLASGNSLPYVPDIPGIETVEPYGSAEMDVESFAGKRVLIIGKGNSAIETCDLAVERAALVHLASRHPVRLGHRTHHPGDLRVHRSRIFDLYQLKLLHSLLDCTVDAITHNGDEYRVEVTYSHAQGEHDVLAYDRVICCTGFRFDASVFHPDCRPELVQDDRLPRMSPTWESTARPGIFFAGTLMQSVDYRKAGSAFIDGFRYNARTLARLLRERYHGVRYPRTELGHTVADLADHLCRRASTTSALWVQFQQLCDVVVSENGQCTVYEELPLQDVPRRFADRPSFWTMHFEWGTLTGDPFAIERHPDAEEAHRSVFLHPVIQHWTHGEVDSTHHLLEDLVGTFHPDYTQTVVRSHNGVSVADYNYRQHVKPLEDYLAATGSGTAPRAVPSGEAGVQ